MNELTTPTNQPAPGSSAMPLPVVGQTTTSGPPPDYRSLGAGQAKADFAAASAGGGWEFDAAAMDKVIQNLEDSLDGDHRRAQNAGLLLTQIVPPGSEVGSTGYVTTAKTSGVSYNDFLKGAVDYITSYVDTLKEIRTAYASKNQDAIDVLRGIRKAD